VVILGEIAMCGKVFAILFVLLFVAPACLGQSYFLDSHVIEIDVDSVGNANVRERFFLQFQNEQQIASFRQVVSEIGASVDGWQAHDGRIFPHIGQRSEIAVSGISFIENTDSLDFLEINYSLNSPIMEKRSETSRVIDYGLKPKYFANFVEGSLWVIPEGTSIIVNLPRGIEIDLPVKPDAAVEGHAVVWTGYVFGNKLELNYSLFKQIASLDLSRVLGELMQSGLFWILLIVAAVASVAVFAKRKAISGKIEAYLVEHSDFGGEEEE